MVREDRPAVPADSGRGTRSGLAGSGPSGSDPPSSDPARAGSQQDEQFVAALVAQHGRAILGYATRLTGEVHLAEDIVQEALVRAWRNREALTEEHGSVRGWLLTVVRNLVIDRARARGARPGEVAENPAAPPAVADHADRLVDSVVVLDAIGQLSPEHRSVLVELYFRGSTIVEAASTLRLPVGTVKSRSFYALRLLRALLEPAQAS
jgi:RNA polymerase sigma-70 factor, ECF subfamily